MLAELSNLPVSIADVERAAARIEGKAVRTPLISSAALDETVGARVLIKPETLQRTGSFKFRGAFNRISQLDEGERERGVVAFSSGNHAQGVAAAAQIAGMPAAIVMPADAPHMKMARTRAYGAEVVTYDRAREDRAEIARTIADERGAALIAPFDDLEVIAGQGTVGLELAADVAARGETLDILLVPCGGGGLIGGTAVAFAAHSPDTRIYAVEPEGFDDYGRSLASGTPQRNAAMTGSICDALLSPEPGEITFEINRRLLAGALTVSDAEVATAMRTGFESLKLVIEPGGAVTLAALLAGKIDIKGARVGIVLSGGNVDAALYSDILAKNV